MSAVLKMLRRQRKTRRRPPARRPRWAQALLVLVLLAVAAGTGLALRAIVLSPWLQLRHVAILGTERLTAADFQEALGVRRGTPLLLVDLDALRARLMDHPGVRGAVVARRLPDTLEATIRERTAIARATVGGRLALVDEDGAVFTARRVLPGDPLLPELRGLVTPAGAPRLAPEDRPGIVALLAYVRITRQPAPEGTFLDLTPKDRIVLRPGHDAPALWLDRHKPDRNLENLFAWKNRVAEIAPGASVDLRFPRRLTLVPPVEEPDGTVTE